jgi:hypothetical protein
MTIIGMGLSCNRDNEWVNPWLLSEPVVLCYRMTFLMDGWPNDPWIHRYTLDYRFNKHGDNWRMWTNQRAGRKKGEICQIVEAGREKNED